MDKIEKNPFTVNPAFNLKVIEYTKESLFIPSTEFGKDAIFQYKKETNTFLSDVQKGVTLYDTPYDHVFMFKEFRPTTRDLLLYIMLKIKENQDWIELKRTTVEKQANISQASYYKALAQLKEYFIILDKKRNQFWVNPYYIFRGNRVKFYKEHYPDNIDITFKKRIDANDIVTKSPN